MPVELRKRKAPEPPAQPPAKRNTKTIQTTVPSKAQPANMRKAAKSTKAAAEPKKPAAVASKAAKAKKADGSGANAVTKPEVGDVITLEGFGGEVETHDGEKTTLKDLVNQSQAGVVLFTYPKASTPGCTKQVCNFRDHHAELTAAGFAVYGLSGDSPRANTTFHDRHSLPYPLLCDPAGGLLRAVGLAKPGPKTGAVRGIFVVGKAGKVLRAETGSPAGTVDVARDVAREVGGEGDDDEAKEEEAANGNDEGADNE